MKIDSQIKIFIGWDSREIDAFEVARYSLLRHSSISLDIKPLKQDVLRSNGLYYRQKDPLASTEFTYTRFLVPYLTHFKGYAIFFDCDFLWLADVRDLIEEIDPGKAVSCVHHEYWPRESTKMDGQIQTQYPRKNWSSLMVFKCDHPDCRTLTAEKVNSATPKFLHRFEWTSDEEIGSVSRKWNWLEGWYDVRSGDPEPAAIHFTRGGPWFENYQDVEYASLWKQEFSQLRSNT